MIEITALHARRSAQALKELANRRLAEAKTLEQTLVAIKMGERADALLALTDEQEGGHER